MKRVIHAFPESKKGAIKEVRKVKHIVSPLERGLSSVFLYLYIT